MCLAVPAQIVELLENGMVKARVGESETYLTTSTMLLPEEAAVGDYIIVHAGFALHKIREEEALETLRLYREIIHTVDGDKANF